MRTIYDLIPGGDSAAAGKSFSRAEEEGGFRNEQKYLLSFFGMQELRLQLAGVMSRDPHAGETGTYLIRSVYFDTPDNLCVRQNEDGVDERSKWRIRIYNADPSVIDLECKYRIHGMTKKEACRITREEFRELMDPHPGAFHPGDRAVLNRFRYLQRSVGFRPAAIVQYVREPFVCPYGNVRVTRDFALESSTDFAHFFAQNIVGRPVLSKGQELLEVKFDQYLPAYLRQAIQQKDMQQTPFSKYYLCRRYGTGV